MKKTMAEAIEAANVGDIIEFDDIEFRDLELKPYKIIQIIPARDVFATFVDDSDKIQVIAVECWALREDVKGYPRQKVVGMILGVTDRKSLEWVDQQKDKGLIFNGYTYL